MEVMVFGRGFWIRGDGKRGKRGEWTTRARELSKSSKTKRVKQTSVVVQSVVQSASASGQIK